MADSANIYVAGPRPGGVGVFYRAPLGTDLPTDAASALGEEYLDHGYAGEEGFVITEAREITDHKAFGGDTVATTQDSYDWSVQVPLLEDTNPIVLGTVYGEPNVEASDTLIVVRHNKLRLPRSVFVIDTIGDNGWLKRQVIPNGQVTAVGEITEVHTGIVSYPLTIKAYPHEGTDNVITYREFVGDGS